MQDAAYMDIACLKHLVQGMFSEGCDSFTATPGPLYLQVAELH